MTNMSSKKLVFNAQYDVFPTCPDWDPNNGSTCPVQVKANTNGLVESITCSTHPKADFSKITGFEKRNPQL